jgi:plant 4alpha-monomethylsterol monooxygenase
MWIVWTTLLINLGCVIFGFFFSYAVLFTSWFDKYRIQPVDKKTSLKVFYQRLPLILLNIGILQLLAGVGVWGALPLLNPCENGAEWGFLGLQLGIFILVDDFYFYWYHRAVHESEYLFKKIHKIHHKAVSPFPLEFIYVHPLEWMIGAVGVALGFGLICLLFGWVNVYAFWLYVFYRSAHEIHIHAGIELGISKYIPFYGTVRQHDEHHAFVKGNYASSLNYLDKLFGTQAPSIKK